MFAELGRASGKMHVEDIRRLNPGARLAAQADAQFATHASYVEGVDDTLHLRTFDGSQISLRGVHMEGRNYVYGPRDVRERTATGGLFERLRGRNRRRDAFDIYEVQFANGGERYELEIVRPVSDLKRPTKGIRITGTGDDPKRVAVRDERLEPVLGRIADAIGVAVPVDLEGQIRERQNRPCEVIAGPEALLYQRAVEGAFLGVVALGKAGRAISVELKPSFLPETPYPIRSVTVSGAGDLGVVDGRIVRTEVSVWNTLTMAGIQTHGRRLFHVASSGTYDPTSRLVAAEVQYGVGREHEDKTDLFLDPSERLEIHDAIRSQLVLSSFVRVG